MKQQAINAFHSNWTRPFFFRSKGQTYFVEDYELLTTILSALEWRKHNGGIRMITDTIGMEYYTNLGLAHIWDMGLDASLDMLDSDHIFPLPFWAAGKIFALRQLPVPIVTIDTDFIVWKPIAVYTNDAALVVAHREGIVPAIYPAKLFFDMNRDYHFPAEWDWTVQPCNTALLYIADEEFKEYYTSESIRFMRDLRESKDTTAEMVFAEQRLLAMCAAAKNLNIKTFLDTDGIKTQDSFTHVWGLKEELNTNMEKRREFCKLCVKKIANIFPEEIAVLEKIDSLKSYMELI